VQLATAPESSLQAKAGSVEVKANVADALLTNPDGPEVIVGTAVGGVLSITYVCPVNDVVASVFCAASLIPVPLTRLSPSVVPEPDGVPVPVDAVTVNVVAEPADGDTPVTDVPEIPAAAVAKFVVETPDTGSLKVIVQDTDAAFVGDEPARLIAVSVGFTKSIVQA
jgi:hypothetical protein